MTTPTPPFRPSAPPTARRRLSALAVLLVALAACSSQPALLRQLRKEELVDTIRQALLESVEAEKSAVLATSDEESQALAGEARSYATKIDPLRDELRTLVDADGRPDEVHALDAFDAAWAELEAVDVRLLKLAVANTNLKAARLSAQDEAAALDRFADALQEMQQASSDPEMIRTLSRAQDAALREEILLLIHIPASDPAEMERLEQQMRVLGDEVERDLGKARDAGNEQERLAAAIDAWREHRRIAADVVRLSRENSNVLSFEVSVHEKRKVTKECLTALDQLDTAIQSGPQPAR